MKFVLLFALLAYAKFPLGNAAGAGQVSWKFHAAFSMLGWLEKRNSCIVHSKKCVGLLISKKLFNLLRLVPIFIILWFQILQQIVHVQVKFVIWIWISIAGARIARVEFCLPEKDFVPMRHLKPITTSFYSRNLMAAPRK